MFTNRLLNIILVLALITVMADRFYFQAEKVSAGRSDPPRWMADCPSQQTRHLLYHRSATSSIANHSYDQERHLLYHRSATSHVMKNSCR